MQKPLSGHRNTLSRRPCPMLLRRSPGRAARWEMPGVTHLGIRVIIYQGGSSGRHPKGARSIGIGHPRSGDRCTEAHPKPHDPLRVAESPHSATHKGSWHIAYACTSVFGTSCLDRCLWSGHPCGCRYTDNLNSHWRSWPMTLKRSTGRAPRRVACFVAVKFKCVSSGHPG